MNQKKIGRFLKELRKEMGITQEEFAEKLDVSSRTISRWETGANMPDISLLVNIAEIFNVSIPEIINGERKSEIMEKETKKVAEAMSDYATAEKEFESAYNLAPDSFKDFINYGTALFKDKKYENGKTTQNKYPPVKRAVFLKPYKVLLLAAPTWELLLSANCLCHSYLPVNGSLYSLRLLLSSN